MEVIAFAEHTERVIITFDRDYGELIFKIGKYRPPGVVYFRFVPETPEEPAMVIKNILAGNIQLAGKFTVVGRDWVRQRPI